MRGAKHILREYYQGFLRLVRSGKTALFVFFFMLALLLWLLQSLQYTYTTIVQIPIRIPELTTDLVPSEGFPEYISVEIRDKGFELLNYDLTRTKEPLVLSFRLSSKRQGVAAWSPEEIEAEVGKYVSQRSRTARILSIYPSEISFEYAPMARKELPVRIETRIDPALGVQIKSVSASPSSVLVAGSKSELATLEYIPTDTLTFDQISESTYIKVPLRLPGARTEVSPREVTLYVQVEELEQVSYVVPIEVPEISNKYVIKTFPTSAVVNCLLPKSYVERVGVEHFRLSVDPSQRDLEQGDSKLPVVIKRYPEIVQMVQVEPEEVEYILEER